MLNQHIVAKTLIINDQNQVLVLRRSVWPAKPHRSHQPDLPGGMVDPGESEHQAAIREIQEETGIVVNPDHVVLGYTKTELYKGGKESISKLLYVAYVDTTPEVTLSYEHETYEWVDLKTVLENFTFGAFYEEGIKYLLGNELI